jgi:hypothetical protein
MGLIFLNGAIALQRTVVGIADIQKYMYLYKYDLDTATQNRSLSSG